MALLSIGMKASVLALAVAAVSSMGCAAESDAPAEDEPVDGTSDELVASPPLDLDKAVAFLGRQVARRTPGTHASIAVHVLGTSSRAELAADLPKPSASSAKAVWAAAALARQPVAGVRGDAQPVFIASDNDAAGRLIDLAGGADAINVFYNHAGMTSSGLLHWSTGGKSRVDANEPHRIGNDNYFTANDAVTFLERLDAGKLLEPAKKNALLGWMTLSPNSGTGGWLTARLPEPARSKTMHKADWLPPDCCESRTLNELGIVPTPSGKRYAVAILTTDGRDWYGKQAPFVEYASCVIYRAIERLPTLRCE